MWGLATALGPSFTRSRSFFLLIVAVGACTLLFPTLFWLNVGFVQLFDSRLVISRRIGAPLCLELSELRYIAQMGWRVVGRSCVGQGAISLGFSDRIFVVPSFLAGIQDLSERLQALHLGLMTESEARLPLVALKSSSLTLMQQGFEYQPPSLFLIPSERIRADWDQITSAEIDESRRSIRIDTVRSDGPCTFEIATEKCANIHILLFNLRF